MIIQNHAKLVHKLVGTKSEKIDVFIYQILSETSDANDLSKRALEAIASKWLI